MLRHLASALLVTVLTVGAAPALAATCGNNAAGFPAWLDEFRQEAAARGIKQSTLDSALGKATYATKTIALDRNQKSFKYDFDTFMKKRGAASIVSKGRQLKASNKALFDRIEAKYGVPAGPLLAIWGMETGFGAVSGKVDGFAALATLAYDCRRSAMFEENLYAALKLLQSGQLDRAEFNRSSFHGEIGQGQFMPAMYVEHGVDGDGDRRIDMVRSRADTLASIANYLKNYGWRRGAGYGPGEPNFQAIVGWNKAGVYQKAIAAIGQDIDGVDG